MLGKQRLAAAEVRLVKIHQPAEIQLVRCLIVLEVYRFEGFIEFHVGHDEGGLQARHVSCRLAVRLNAQVGAGGKQGIPPGDAVLGVDPQLVTQVAGKTGA